MPDVAFVNGRFTPLEQAVISINDRGLLFGDSVYETVSAYEDTPLLLNEHLERVLASATQLGFNVTGLDAVLSAAIYEGISRAGYPETTVYIQLTRGTHPRGHIFPDNLEPTAIVTFRMKPEISKGFYKHGIQVITLPDLRAQLCQFKTTNLLPNILAKNEANSRGAFEALLIDEDNNVSEACSSSLFLVESTGVVSPPAGPKVLPGVTQSYIAETLTSRVGLKTKRETISLDRLLTAKEVFLTATSYLVAPVVSIDDNTIADGKPGPTTQALLAEARVDLSRTISTKCRIRV